MKRLKYVSRFAKHFTEKEIDDLVAFSRESNEKTGITGVLMTTGGMFYQVIEGPDSEIDRLYQSISRDVRHTDVLLLGAEENVSQRLFPDWSMGRIDLDQGSGIRVEPLRALLEAIVQNQQVVERMTRSLELAVWHELGPDHKRISAV